MDVNQDIVRYVDATGKVLKQAEQLVDQLAREEQKIAADAPKVASLLASNGLIRKTEHDVATKKLASHEGALEVVQNLIAELGQTKRAYEQKIASAGNGHIVDPRSLEMSSPTFNSMSGGVVGQRRGLGQKSAADHAYEDIILGNR
jgi:hypothetical protein